ncbi:MAG: YbjN domain-containing protein [Chitinophagales bacterium]|nr:YbjN domain-containing protein [Chitinophagales bacterium]
MTSTKDIALVGIRRSIEYVIQKLGFDPAQTQKGHAIWVLNYNSATLHIAYHEYSGFIIGDVYLCRIPDDKNKLSDLYFYLLQQNDKLQGFTLSINEAYIVLSLLIYDQSLHIETMYQLFRRLLDTADAMDNLLVDSYGAKW